MRRRLIGTASAVLLVLVIADPARAAVVKVRDTKANEVGYVVGDDGAGRTVRAWSSDTLGHPGRYTVWVKDGPAAAHAITGSNVSAFIGGIDINGPHGDLISYEVYSRATGNFDIRLYNITTHQPVHLADAMNTAQNEIHPSISGEWLLFGRGQTVPRRIVLFKLDGTGEVRTIARASGGSNLQAGQVNGDYAVYDECDDNGCNVHRYQISTMANLVAPNAGRGAYSPGVSSTGVVNYAIGHPTACGVHTSLRRWNGVGSAQNIATLQEGVDVSLWTYVYDRPLGGATMYFTRVVCHGTFPTGIYGSAA